ncbi:conserved hypothetical protein [delta proteobacterium NaphS2]|nr:conserved hypothetical protein [delta proteobacterium NaphS2]
MFIHIHLLSFMDNHIVKDKRCTPLAPFPSSLGRLDFKPLTLFI